jgi:hypothetical protein
MVQKWPSPSRVFFHSEIETSRWLTLTRSPTWSGVWHSISMVVMMPTGRSSSSFTS